MSFREAIVIQSTGSFTVRVEGPPSNTLLLASTVQQRIEAEGHEGLSVEAHSFGVACYYGPHDKSLMKDLIESSVNSLRDSPL